MIAQHGYHTIPCAQSGTPPVDFVAYAGDEALGGQFSQWVESLFLAAPALAQLCFHVYNAVALGLAAILAWQTDCNRVRPSCQRHPASE